MRALLSNFAGCASLVGAAKHARADRAVDIVQVVQTYDEGSAGGRPLAWAAGGQYLAWLGLQALGFLALTVLVESGLLGRAARGTRRAALRGTRAVVGGVCGVRSGTGPPDADAEAGGAGGDDVDVAAERAALRGGDMGGCQVRWHQPGCVFVHEPIWRRCATAVPAVPGAPWAHRSSGVGRCSVGVSLTLHDK